MATIPPNSAEEVKNIRYAALSLFPMNALSIGKRLTVCFLIIVVSMIAASALVLWQFRQMVVPSRRLSNADQISLAIVRLHLDVAMFRENVAALESRRTMEQFSNETAGLRRNFLRDVEDAQRALGMAPEIAREDPTILAELETLKVTLPSQLDRAVQLAAAGDWNAIRLRLEHQIQDLIGLTSSLVEKLDRQAQLQRTQAIEDAERAQQRLFWVVIIAGLLTLMVAVALGGYTTQSITVPLSELASGAQALARGDLSHQVSVCGKDELAVVGRALNNATRQLQELYEELREQASLLSLTHDAIYVRDMEGVIRYWNHGAEELYGWPAEHAVGKVAHELLKAVPRLPFDQIETELLRNGRWEGELLKTKRDGTQVVVASRGSMKRDDRGEPVAVLVTSNDITERKRAEEDLRQSERRYRDIFQTAGVAIWEEDFSQVKAAIEELKAQGVRDFRQYTVEHPEFVRQAISMVKVIDVNNAALKLFGAQSRDELLVSLNKLFGLIPVSQPRTDEVFARELVAIAEGQPFFETEHVAQNLKGDRLTVLLRIAFPPQPSKLDRVLVTNLDITERKRAEEALRTHAERLQSLYAVNLALSQTLNLETLLGQLLAVTHQLIPHDGMSIMLLEDGGSVRVRAARGYQSNADPKLADSASFRPEAFPLIARVLKGKVSVEVPDTQKDPDWIVVRGAEHARSWLGVPLVASGAVIGLFSLDKAQPGFFTADHQQIARMLAAPAAVAIQNAQFHEQIQTYARELEMSLAELKKRDEAVRRSERELRDVIETIPAIVWTTLPDGSLDFINHRWREFTGLSVEDALGWNWEAAIHPDDRARYIADLRAALTAGQPLENEVRVRAANGEYRWLFVRNVPLRDELGNIVKWYGMSLDIDARRKAEEALRRSEAYLAEAQKLTHTGSFAYNGRTDTFPYWSEEHFRIWGLDPQQAPPSGQALLQRVHPDDREMVIERSVKALRERSDYSAQYRIVLPDGTMKYIEAIGHHVSTDQGGPLQVIGTHVDITERKRAEQERERLRQLEAELAHINRMNVMGEMTASIAHEINQPLSGVVSNASACLRWLAGESPNLQEAREAGQRIVRDGKRAGEIIARVRALVRKAATPKARLDLNETVREVLALIAEEAKKKKVTIQTEFAEDLAPILGDRVQLQQVALNIVMNAMDAMSDSTRKTLLITTSNNNADQVCLAVRDTGTGLDPDALERIFEPFYSTKPGGMGMGLSISRSIIQNHGGKLWAVPNEGEGATVGFTIPRYREGEPGAGT